MKLKPPLMIPKLCGYANFPTVEPRKAITWRGWAYCLRYGFFGPLSMMLKIVSRPLELESVSYVK